MNLYIEDVGYEDIVPPQLLHWRKNILVLSRQTGIIETSGDMVTFRIELPAKLMVQPTTEHPYLVVRVHLSLTNDRTIHSGDFITKRAYPVSMSSLQEQELPITLEAIK
ncbi:MAG: hypothetical protein V3U76_15775 [Granulosicoccus sp.]